MEIKKMSIGDRVFLLASKYGIEQTKVHTIISAYTDYCKEMLYQGYRVDLLGLASLIPDREKTGLTTTLAYECRDIADDLCLPKHTVYVIVQEYLDSLVEDILKGNPVEIRGLLSVVPINDGEKVIKVHSVISSQMKEHLKERNTGVTAVRVHTHKMLKYNVGKNDYLIPSEV
jgi:nucleoid DNA-binding protein